MAVDLDLDVGVDPARQGMHAVRVEDTPRGRPGRVREIVQPLVQLPERGRLEVDQLNGELLRRDRSHQTFAFSQT